GQGRAAEEGRAMRPTPDWRENLPFLAGKAAVVNSVAARHHELINDPAPISLRPHVSGEPSWATLREAGYKGPRLAGQQVAAAKTEAEAATATLRWEKYLSALDSAEVALLGVTARHLANGPLPDFDTGCFVGYVSYGRRGVGQPLELIPSAHWETP